MTTLDTASASIGLERHYARLCSSRIEGQEVTAWSSTEWEDQAWDSFLEATPLGQYQQSSLWARAKRAEGWRPFRIIITTGSQITAGFQILARNTRFGSIGYVSKGPVVVPEDEGLMDFAVDLVVSAVKQNRLKALILQPPDASRKSGGLLARWRFLPNQLVGVNSATLIVDVSCGEDEIVRRMRRTTLLELKRSQKRGMRIREGGPQDLGTFFRLMSATCKRQETSPSPATESNLSEIWKTFHAVGRIRLSLAEYEGQAVAAGICLCFGDRVTFWKKGWTGEHRHRHPNQMVMFDAIQWSHRLGYKHFDCAAMNHGTAVALLSGTPLSEAQKRGRDFFLLGYGGTPTLLPESLVCISNPVVRWLYRCPVATTWCRTLTKRLAVTRA